MNPIIGNEPYYHFANEPYYDFANEPYYQEWILLLEMNPPTRNYDFFNESIQLMNPPIEIM